VVSVGAIMSWPSCCRHAPGLRILPRDSSKAFVSYTGSIRESHPILGFRSSPNRVKPESGWRSILLVWRMGSWGHKLIM